MIDFVKIRYQDKAELEQEILSSRNFKEVKAMIDIHTQKYEYPLIANYKNIRLRVTENMLIVKNSLHIFYNQINGNGIQNYNDFSYTNLVEAIETLARNIKGIKEQRLTNLEYGLNIEVPETAESIINNNVYFHKYKEKTTSENYYGKGKYIQFKSINYLIKMYDKAKQYEINEKNILRFEIKFTNSKEFKKFDIKNLNDLLDKRKLQLLQGYLIKRFDELLIIDDFTALSDVSKSYLNSKHWSNYERKDRNRKAKHIKEFEKELIEKKLLKTKNLLRQKLIEKFNVLINN